MKTIKPQQQVLNKDYSNYTNLQQQSVAKLLAFTKKSEGYRKEYICWKYILRGDAEEKENPTFKNQHLGKSAQNLLAPIIQKLMKGERVVFNHKYISSITGTGQRQNKNIIKELSGVLNIKYHRSIIVNGKKRNRSYEFRIKAETPEEARDTEEYLEKSTGKFISHHYKKENNNIEDIRSSSHTRESTFSNNFNSDIQLKTSHPIATKEAVVAERNQEATIHTLKDNKLRRIHRTNQRKKATKAQKKANKAKLLQFKQYDEPKDLAYHYPLTADDCSILQRKSNRYFNLNAQNQILLAMSRKTSLQGHRFASKAQFMAYMGKALMHEMRDAEKTANSSYYIQENLTEKQLIEYNRQAELEKFLNKIEQQAITQVCPENQLKAKLSNTLLPIKAYSLLAGLIKFQLVDNTMEIHLHSSIDFTENDKNVILSQVQAVYGDVQLIKFIIQKAELTASNSNIQQQESYSSENSEFLQLPQGVWGNIAKQLVARYGVDTYKNWFSKLTATIDETNSTIELKASSVMVQDWIGSRYENFIEQIAATIGFRLRGLK
jgi:hypothetical protein